MFIHLTKHPSGRNKHSQFAVKALAIRFPPEKACFFCKKIEYWLIFRVYISSIFTNSFIVPRPHWDQADISVV